MKKVVVIGCPGTGTQEFGKRLSKSMGIPYHDITEVYRFEEENIIKNVSFNDRVQEMTKNPTWVIAGNYVGPSLEIRLKECDTIFFLDYPCQLCRDLIMANPDTGITWGVVVRFDRDYKPEILKMLERYSEKNIFVFKNEEEKTALLMIFLPDLTRTI